MQQRLIQITSSNPLQGRTELTSQLPDLAEGWVIESIAGGIGSAEYTAQAGNSYPENTVSWLILLRRVR